MLKKFALSALVITLVCECGRSDDKNSNKTYTIKLGSDKKGDKTLFSLTDTLDIKAVYYGPKAGTHQVKKESQKLEYIQVIKEMTEGDPSPTKLTRFYATAETTQSNGEKKPFSFAGSTVTIEKKGDKYSYTVPSNQTALTPEDVEILKQEFEGNGTDNQEFAPKIPVKVGDKWDLNTALLKDFARVAKFPINAEKSKTTGRLMRAYTKEGKLWGMLSIKSEIVVGNAKPMDPVGTITMGIIMDVPIDGSTFEGVIKSKMAGDVTVREKGTERRVVLEDIRELTIKTAK